MSVVELLAGFMAFYAQFDFSEWILCVGADSGLESRYGSCWYDPSPVCMRDPCGGAEPARSLRAEGFQLFADAVNNFNRLLWVLADGMEDAQLVAELCEMLNICHS